MKKQTILLYGRTRSGKSTNIAELAEHIYKTTGKKTRVYTADRGGVGPMVPYIDLGIVEVVSQESSDPWIFLNRSVRGYLRDSTGKWILDAKRNEEIGLWAFESMTAFADALMTSLAEKSAQGINVGGGSNTSLSVSGDGESLKIGGSNMAHYNVVQTRITEEVWESQKLAGQYVLWTASVSKDDDATSNNKVLGPQVVGKALTSEVPRWFNLCFRVDALPAQQGKPERHVLYLGLSTDVAAGNAISLGNTRVPKDAPELPSSIEPASLVKAITLIEEGHAKALDIVRKRLASELVRG